VTPLPIREDLRGAVPYGAPQLDVPVRLNTNENPYPPPPEVAAAVAEALAQTARTLNRYPDREAAALRADLATYAGHTPEGTWAANGSNEVIQQLLQAFGGPGRTALGFEPSYSMHRLIALGTGTGWVAEDRADDFTIRDAAAAVARHDPDVVFLCSPNNPTGTALPHEVIEEVYDATRGMVVVDEAYAEFSHAPSAAALLPGRERLVVTRTMSKAFALAGARVGYALADPAVVDALRLVRLPYHLSSLTQAAACAALRHAPALLGNVATLRGERDRLVGALHEQGREVVPSDANFVLFGRFADAAATWQALLDKGVLVRDVSGAVPGWLRVTAGTPEENDAFLAALREVTA
jgi:histidinol-phosphate aminotransferase